MTGLIKGRALRLAFPGGAWERGQFIIHHSSFIIPNRCLAALISIAILVGAVITLSAKAEEPLLHEYRVKTAFLYNFAKFVQWPEAAFVDLKSPVTICILGKDPLIDVLQSLTAKTIQGRRIVVSYSKNVMSVKGCHILFVAKSEKSRIKHTISKLKGSPVLTVSDVDDFVKAGGMIGMVRVENKIRFHINLVSAQDSGLTISSQLLKLAIDVIK